MTNNNLLRPKNLDEFIGQEKITSQLKVYIYSALKQKKPIDHILLYGPPGCGKTSLAFIIGSEMKSTTKIINAPLIETIKDLIETLSAIKEGDILFIDEIHRLEKEIEETLYSVMEDFEISINYKSKENNKLLKVKIPPFTLIGATTAPNLLSNPLRDRFGITFAFSYYTQVELAKIIMNNSNKFTINIDEQVALELAKRSRKTPELQINY